MIEKKDAGEIRKVLYVSTVVGDVLDRLLWRIRPYERAPGMTDAFLDKATATMADAFEAHGASKEFERIFRKLDDIVKEGKAIIDFQIPRKPLVGIVGEIYLRTHVKSNQDIIRLLEKYGAEVVNASVAEWVDYTTYDKVRASRMAFWLDLKQRRVDSLKASLKDLFKFGCNLLYQNMRHDQIYRRVGKLLDVAQEHRVSHLDHALKKNGAYSFEFGTEACLSIPCMMEYMRDGYNGVINVYPFTCMPSTITSSIIKPMVNEKKIPFLDAPYDATYQPGREAAIRTFMYQAEQHFKKYGRKRHG
jgi:predicted nucleotide-binding protein (sugar kinase/HSP70/actin superfamily)